MSGMKRRDESFSFGLQQNYIESQKTNKQSQTLSHNSVKWDAWTTEEP
jgi:hypothetical protein